MIHWTKPTESGLGDRLVDLVHMVAYARTLGQSLACRWMPFRMKDIDIAHRATDIRLENVLAHIRFPHDLHFGTVGDERFDHAIGGDPDPEGFYRKYLSERCSLDYYVGKFNGVAKDFGFCGEIQAFLADVPRKFVAFHIRRGDKVRDEPGDGTFIHESELADLDARTYRAIDRYMGFDAFFFCGDEDAKVAPFADYVRRKGRAVVQLPAMEKWRATYYDLAVMSRSRAIVTSNRYSAFSRFSAIIGDVPVATAYQL